MQCPSCHEELPTGRRLANCPGCGASVVPAVGSAARGRGEPGLCRDVEPGTTRTEAKSDDPWAPGNVVAGKYRIVGRVGSGGFGSVFKVRHVFRRKYYALKTPHPEYLRDPVFRKRFEREIEAMERFVHPDAVLIRDSGVTPDGCPYYTMDFIEGESLKVLLEREGSLPVQRAVGIASRVLKVLDVAHAHGIIHRDIKPDNILLTRGGESCGVKVVDFGVAKLLDLVGDTGSITQGQRIGTPKYMPPEQILGEEVDPRSDLFSVGVVLYEMLTGHHPFTRAKDPIRATGAILSREPTPLRELVPTLPRRLEELLAALLDKKLRKRPASAEEVLEELRGLELPRVELSSQQRLSVVEGVRREAAGPLVLREESSGGERRCFLFFEERTAMGRSSERGQGSRSLLLLRCLPCRSQKLDPVNWEKNTTISHSVCTLRPDGSTLIVEPAPGLRGGFAIGGLPSTRPVRIQSSRFSLEVGDAALEIDGYRSLRSADAPDLELDLSGPGRPLITEPPALIGYSNRVARIDSVTLLRVNNAPLHEYHLVYRQLGIGSSASAGLRLLGRGVEGLHLAVIFDAGESFLLAFEPGVSLRPIEGDAGGSAKAELRLRPGTLFPLVPGWEIRVGDHRLVVEATVPEHFKRL